MIRFANPGLLWALVLVVAPIILHLLRRRVTPPPVIPFSATQLLEAPARELARRTRLREWLLVAIRTLLLAALVLAFARPYLTTDKTTSTPPSLARQIRVRVLADQSEYLTAALGNLPEQGPNTLIFLGPNPSIAEDQIGAKLVGMQTGEVTVAAGPYFHPALQIFDEPGHGDLRDVRVRRWWKLEPVGRTVVMARLSNGDPFMIEHWTDTGRVITCALPADADWSDLPLHPNFVPLVQELVKYLERTSQEIPAGPGADAAPTMTAALLTMALVLAVAELGLGGISVLKLGAVAILFVVLVHPQFSWQREREIRGTTLLINDHTDSMRWRTTPSLPNLPQSSTVRLTGRPTALGEALLAHTNDPPARVVLLSDGKHNAGVSPAWAAAWLRIPVFTVAVGTPEPPRDVSIVRLDAPDMVVSGEVAVISATIRTTSVTGQLLAVSITGGGQPLLNTNVPGGDVKLAVRLPRTGLYELRVATLPDEATPDNNRRQFAVTVLPDKIHVFLRHDRPDWEYRHVRHALERDPAVKIVEGQSAGFDLAIGTSNVTWRLRGQSDEAFQRYWSDWVRSEFRRKHPASVRSSGEPQSEELFALWRNDELLREVARVSGGRFFTSETLADLPATVRAIVRRERRRFDLRDSALVLLAIAAGFIASWALRRSA